MTPPGGLLDAVGLVILQIIVKFLQLHLSLLIPGVHPVEVQGREAPLTHTLVSSFYCNIRDCTAPACPLAVPASQSDSFLCSLWYRNVLWVAWQYLNNKPSYINNSAISNISPNRKLESLHPVAGTVFSNELQPVQLGQPHVGIAGGLQVQAGVLHHVHHDDEDTHTAEDNYLSIPETKMNITISGIMRD